MVSTLIAGVIGIAMVCGFLAILLIWVPALPIVIIILMVIAMMVYDFWLSLRGNGSTPYRR